MKILNHRSGFNPYGLTMNDGYPYTREETKAFFSTIEITEDELSDLNEWVKAGFEFYSNPWNIFTEKGRISNFIEACRFINDMYEEYLNGTYIASSTILDSPFLYEDIELPF